MVLLSDVMSGSYVNSMKLVLVERGYSKPVLLLHPLGGWTKDDDVPLMVGAKYAFEL